MSPGLKRAFGRSCLVVAGLMNLGAACEPTAEDYGCGAGKGYPRFSLGVTFDGLECGGSTPDHGPVTGVELLTSYNGALINKSPRMACRPGTDYGLQLGAGPFSVVVNGITADGNTCWTSEPVLLDGRCDPLWQVIDAHRTCPPACGNRIVEEGEQCDDGNRDDGDECPADCRVGGGGPQCMPLRSLGCNMTVNGTNDMSGSTSLLSRYSCQAAFEESGPEVAYIFSATASGTVTAQMNGDTSDLDIYVIESRGSAGCDPAACVASGERAATFVALAGHTYFIVVDGKAGTAAGFNLSLTCQ